MTIISKTSATVQLIIKQSNSKDFHSFNSLQKTLQKCLSIMEYRGS